MTVDWFRDISVQIQVLSHNSYTVFLLLVVVEPVNMTRGMLSLRFATCELAS